MANYCPFCGGSFAQEDCEDCNNGSASTVHPDDCENCDGKESIDVCQDCGAREDEKDL